MLTPKLNLLQATLKRLMRRGAAGPLEKVLAKTHAADLAYLLSHFSETERLQLLGKCVSDDKRAEVLAAADADLAAGVLAALPRERAVDLLHRIAPDDVSDILEHLPNESADDLLKGMRGSERSEVEDLSRYDSATAGGIMNPRFLALDQNITVREAIEQLQRMDTAIEMVFYVYVVNEHGQLQGVVSLRQLVTNRPDTRLVSLMTSDVISIQTDVHQEEVAKLASRYGLLAIPVVDPANKLLGIVTLDDVIDVLHEEAAEDILRMAGAGPQAGKPQTMWQSLWARFPWLLATCTGGAVGALLLATYGPSLRAYLPMVFFLPLVLALAGVSGRQSATIVNQSLGQGIQGRALASQVFKQALAGLLLGLVCGGVVSLFTWVWKLRAPLLSSVPLAEVILGAGVAAAVTSAATLGALLPVLFARIRLDPTLATGPFVTISVDLTGLLLYLLIVTLFVVR
ncbi:MAG: magnesium transporter [Deltaproteobacteria bacterium]|nr:magnesium transporter [Deltaproteobacteria bacterium]